CGGCRLLPRTLARPTRSRGFARQHSLLEGPDRDNRSRELVHRGPDLRTKRLRQDLAGESRSAAEIGDVRDGGVCGGDRRGDRGPAAQGATSPGGGPAGRPGPGRVPGGGAAGAVSGSGPEGTAGAGPVRAVAPCQENTREHGVGASPAAV